jgi:hypothetical protein
VAAKREPKTIEEARTLLLAFVPDWLDVTVYAHWSDYRGEGRAWSSVGYSCTLYRGGPARDKLLDVQAHTPAKLCKEVVAKLAALLAAEQRAASGALRRPKFGGPTLALTYDAPQKARG